MSPALSNNRTRERFYTLRKSGMSTRLSYFVFPTAFLILPFVFLPAQATADHVAGHVGTGVGITVPTGASTSTTGGGRFSRDGIMGCNSAQFGGSPGTTAAIGGVYVPVYDAAVALNTGVLVYKECVLKGIAIRMREKLTVDIAAAGTVAIQNGRQSYDASGNLVQSPLYSQNLRQEKLSERDRVTALALQNGTFNNLNPAFREDIKRAVARGYYNSTRNGASGLQCPYDDLENALAGRPESVDAALEAFQNPACSPVSAYITSENYVNNVGNTAVNEMIQKLDWSGGIFDIAAPNERGEMVTQTPGRFVASSQEQLLQSGFRQAEAADDIDEMVNGLFAGLSTEIIRSNRGLAGLTQPIGSQPSYLNQMRAAATQGLQNSVNNAVIAILRDAQLIEKAYGDVMRAILNQMSSTQGNFKEAERLCWSAIIQKTCAPDTLKSDGSCTSVSDACTTADDGTVTCPVGNALKVATSTIYSQAAIGGSTTFTLKDTVERNVTASDNAIKLFVTLIESVNGSASQSAQLQAQLQLDSLISQGLIHRQTDLDQAIAARKAIDASIAQSGTYVKEVKAAWNGDAADGTAGAVSWNGTYPPKVGGDIVGWCNVNNAATIQNWVTKWKK